MLFMDVKIVIFIVLNSNIPSTYFQLVNILNYQTIIFSILKVMSNYLSQNNIGV